MTNFYYQELDGNKKNLSETGYLYGGEVSLEVDYRRIKSVFNVSKMSGEVDYQGRTQTGNPHNTKTKQSIIQYGASIGYSFIIGQFESNNISIQPNLNVLVYHWRRDIQPNKQVSRLVEDYDGFILQPSLIATLSSYQLQIGLTRTFDNSMTIQPTRCIERVTVKPKSDHSWFFQGEYVFYKNDTNTASVWTSYKEYKMKESNIKLGNTCFGTVGWREPDNDMKLWQLGIKFTF